MYQALYRNLKSFKSGTDDETNGRHIIPAEAVRASGQSPVPRILDVGAGRGADLTEITRLFKQSGKIPQLFAVESFPVSIEALRQLGVTVVDTDIEHAPLPFDSNTFDLVICNQVLEHTKEIFWVVSELARVMKADGTIILGVPNLGSFHNRIALLLGHQPPAIAVFGAHVRGFTVPGLTAFLESGGLLRVDKVLGGNLYPFPPKISRPLSRLFPTLSVSSFYIVKRVRPGNFLDLFSSSQAAVLVDTPYFRGKQQAEQARQRAE